MGDDQLQESFTDLLILFMFSLCAGEVWQLKTENSNKQISRSYAKLKKKKNELVQILSDCYQI